MFQQKKKQWHMHGTCMKHDCGQFFFQKNFQSHANNRDVTGERGKGISWVGLVTKKGTTNSLIPRCGKHKISFLFIFVKGIPRSPTKNCQKISKKKNGTCLRWRVYIWNKFFHEMLTNGSEFVLTKVFEIVRKPSVW